jgi:CDP-paratose 2-epimerase
VTRIQNPPWEIIADNSRAVQRWAEGLRAGLGEGIGRIGGDGLRPGALAGKRPVAHGNGGRLQFACPLGRMPGLGRVGFLFSSTTMYGRTCVVNTILVTGGAGFVGSRLAIGMREHGVAERVIALDNLRRRGSELNLTRLQEAGVEFLHGDVRNPEDLDAAGAVDLILECSAEPSVLAGYGGSPAYVVNTNLAGTVNCLEAARRHGAAMIFLSTSRVYPMETIRKLRYLEGESRFELAPEQETPGVSAEGISEAFPLEGLRSLYGATKLSSELILREYCALYGLRGIVNRCGVIAGPWQMGKVDQGVAVLWVARHVYGGSLQYIGYGGTGKQVRDLLHVDDLLELVLRQVGKLEELDGETFNVGGGLAVSTSLQELTAVCREVTGNTIEIGAEPDNRAADIPLYITDNAKVTAATGWLPSRNLRDVVADIYQWIEAHRDALAPILS